MTLRNSLKVNICLDQPFGVPWGEADEDGGRPLRQVDDPTPLLSLGMTGWDFQATAALLAVGSGNSELSNSLIFQSGQSRD